MKGAYLGFGIFAFVCVIVLGGVTLASMSGGGSPGVNRLLFIDDIGGLREELDAKVAKVGDQTLVGTLRIEGDQIVTGDHVVFGKEIVDGDVIVNGDEIVHGNLAVDKRITLDGVDVATMDDLERLLESLNSKLPQVG